MSFDGVFTHGMVTELREKIGSGRISKIHQPYENEIVLVIRQHGKNQKLLLSAHPSYARIQLTEMDYKNPEQPPTFCTSLRKYLDGAILEEIQQVENDRVVHFSFSKRNELGDIEKIGLIVEIMGRHSAVILMNKETGLIIDCMKHVGSSQNSYRLLLPGAAYVAPPNQEKHNPFSVSKQVLFEILSTSDTIDRAFLQTHFQGLGQDTAKELSELLKQNPQEKLKTWELFFNKIKQDIQPTLTTKENKEFFTPIPYASLGTEQQFFDSLSELLDAFYAGKAEKDRVKQQMGAIEKRIENERKKNLQKLKKLEKSLLETENAEDIRQKGELLHTFSHQIERGQEKVILPNYYDEDREITIPLNPALSPIQNAQKYFQKYQKMKNSVSILQNQIAQTKVEISYLESVLSQLALASPLDLEVIQEELLAQGFIKKSAKQRKKKAQKSQPERYLSTDGDLILVGKNNLQNDQLTLKTAKKTDIWLHAKDIPGSHVIIKNSEPSEQTLIEAAQLAAYFSKYRLSASVPVDYVQVKHVHKPNGAKPGYVIYEKQKTLYVTPESELVRTLKEKV